MVKAGGEGSVIYVIYYFFKFYLVLGTRYQQGHCPDFCSSCNFCFLLCFSLSNVFYIF